MKITGKAIISKKQINDKELYFLKIREYNRIGEYKEAELNCRLTNKVKELVNAIENDLEIEIKDSFYLIDNYYKGEEKYTKPILVLSEIEII